MVWPTTFCYRSLLVRLDGSAVDQLDCIITRGADCVHQPPPYARLSPSYKRIVVGRAWTIALWQVSLGRTGSEHQENAVRHTPIIDTAHISRLVGQERFDYPPFEVGQVVLAQIEQATAKLAAETGLIPRSSSDGEHVAGIYHRRVTLSSGRFVMIEDGLGFQLVPWRPALDRRLGKDVKGVTSPGGVVHWHFGRRRGACNETLQCR